MTRTALRFSNKHVLITGAARGIGLDIAPAFFFLASEESSFMTGQVIIIDGGQLAGQKL